jgi:hypothetical protein
LKTIRGLWRLDGEPLIFIRRRYMKRIFLFAFICLIALMGVFANEGAAYPAASEPALAQQSLGQHFCIAELSGVPADPSLTYFRLYPPCSVQDEAVASVMGITGGEPGMSLSGPTTINLTGQTNLVNFSPGIMVSRAVGERFLS